MGLPGEVEVYLPGVPCPPALGTSVFSFTNVFGEGRVLDRVLAGQGSGNKV